MSITTRLRLRHDRLALVPTLQALDGVEISVITQGLTDPGRASFPFFVGYDDRARLEEAFDGDETVESYELVDWTDGRGIYYVEYAPDAVLISTVVADVNGVVVSMESEGERWAARLVLPDRAALTAVWEYAAEHDIDLEIAEVYGNEGVTGERSYGLTDEQREALLLAYERGYFAEPRETDLGGIADEMGLSSTAMSGRMRRGIRNLIAATFGSDRGQDRDGES
ncbi:MAG: helix-turn-helix domain-containing protein [Haloferacaceae archaeon]